MRRYENNIGNIMPIRNFGSLNGKEIKFCVLKEICKMDTMCYFIELLSEDKNVLGSRWITGHMYRYHVLNKSY